jgi:hypothetical protein
MWGTLLERIWDTSHLLAKPRSHCSPRSPGQGPKKVVGSTRPPPCAPASSWRRRLARRHAQRRRGRGGRHRRDRSAGVLGLAPACIQLVRQGGHLQPQACNLLCGTDTAPSVSGARDALTLLLWPALAALTPNRAARWGAAAPAAVIGALLAAARDLESPGPMGGWDLTLPAAAGLQATAVVVRVHSSTLHVLA